MRTRAVAIVALAWALTAMAAPAWSQRAVGAIRREDLGQQFLALERALAEKPPAPANRSEVHARFDRATLHFFQLELAEAMLEIADLRLWLAGLEGPERIQALALASLRAEATPRIAMQAPSLRLQSVVADPRFADLVVPARLVLQGSDQVWEQGCELRFDGEGQVEPVDWAWPAGDAKGDFRFEVLGAQAMVQASTWLTVLGGKPLDQRASELGKDLLALEGPSAEAFASRLALLQGTVSEERSMDFLSPRMALATALTAEAQALRGGQDPYVAKGGSFWRTYSQGRQRHPLWVVAPTQPAPDAAPALLIALHGAGGDECFFAHAGGAGRLAELAQARGFVLACPRSADLLYNFGAFDALVAEMQRCYGIDPERVVALGHSMGAMTLGTLLKGRDEALAAAVLIAGARELRCETPVLILGGDQDPIVSAAGLRRAARDSRCGDGPPPLELLPGGGHTLILPWALERACDWLGL